MNCSGYVRDPDSEDQFACRPCPEPATWISSATGSPMCDWHRQAIESIWQGEGAPEFRSVDDFTRGVE